MEMLGIKIPEDVLKQAIYTEDKKQKTVKKGKKLYLLVY